MRAIAAVTREADHPSRPLVERLIANQKAWQVACGGWKKLVANRAQWEFLLSILTLEGSEALLSELQHAFRLTARCADAVVSFLNHETIPQTGPFLTDSQTDERAAHAWSVGPLNVIPIALSDGFARRTASRPKHVEQENSLASKPMLLCRQSVRLIGDLSATSDPGLHCAVRRIRCPVTAADIFTSLRCAHGLARASDPECTPSAK